eukprot:TRINITY_DN16568_c0_g1_i1.p1 TRINITY_DN16568_c0_g1~~TRINITY_DN16568_c0_g1_i1.p1  ORF type:complete len:281 (+),score=33.33 TRINITY_DN16568_c0_g1_i1:84-926(+)
MAEAVPADPDRQDAGAPQEAAADNSDGPAAGLPPTESGPTAALSSEGQEGPPEAAGDSHPIPDAEEAEAQAAVLQAAARAQVAEDTMPGDAASGCAARAVRADAALPPSMFRQMLLRELEETRQRCASLSNALAALPRQRDRGGLGGTRALRPLPPPSAAAGSRIGGTAGSVGRPSAESPTVFAPVRLSTGARGWPAAADRLAAEQPPRSRTECTRDAYLASSTFGGGAPPAALQRRTERSWVARHDLDPPPVRAGASRWSTPDVSSMMDQDMRRSQDSP